jgi:YegS/Rv2252/BmrU family lipid kinase
MNEHPPARRIKLIANPTAGGAALGKIRQARACLEKRGCSVSLVLTAARGDAVKAAAAARDERIDLVIAAGGDGTLCEVINGLVPSDVPLAFLPLGTTNVFALEAGIPFNVERACALALEGTPRAVCLGMAGETRFLLMAGAGFDAEVVSRVNLPLKRRVGKLAYLAAAGATLLRWPPKPVEVQLEDGTTLQGYGAIIGNGRLYGGRFSVTPEASLEEESLDVCLFLRPGRLQMLRCAAIVAIGGALEAPHARCFKTREVRVRGEGVAVQIDGDYLGRLPMTFRAVAGELKLVLPPCP